MLVVTFGAEPIILIGPVAVPPTVTVCENPTPGFLFNSMGVLAVVAGDNVMVGGVPPNDVRVASTVSVKG